MQRFSLQQNILRFRGLLAEETNEASRRTLKSLLAETQRELALLDAALLGVGPELPAPSGVGGVRLTAILSWCANSGASSNLRHIAT